MCCAVAGIQGAFIHMTKTSLTLTNMDEGVKFYHESDERAFFEWLGRIACVEYYVREGSLGLVVHLTHKPR